ncbi:fibronectin type III-like domain-contianing protein [Acidipila sp. EB88]|uniref:fibronectin type III-like domain-contianing protein n=1 Tax=Acidipila sp. EB88 TaxID=2305226 RepID=UPI001F3129F8|nr:fibronectin type III-like domain-contianing protein [Acidipila sp. EB88]
MGYRWFDEQKIEPLFPFGYGLSYTHFALSGLKARTNADGGATVTIHVKNAGSLAGDAVPEVYLAAPATRPEGAQFAPRTLAAFDRVSLKAGEERDVTLEVKPRAFEYWSVQDKAWKKPAGVRTILAGGSSRDLPLSAEVR